MRREILIIVLILIISLFALFFSVDVKAYDDNGNYFTCYNCGDCIDALNNNTYNEVKLGADILDYSGTCIADPENFTNKIFDCQGHVIDGDKTGTIYGISLIGKTNNTIRNCAITEFQYGIYLRDSSNNNTITNSVIINNTGTGIYLDDSSNNTLINNTINNHTSGILIVSGSNTVINNNTLINNYYGIDIDHSSNNLLRNNTMDNDYNLRIYGGEISHFYQDIDTSNLVNGKPIYYWTNEKNAPNNCKNAEINESSTAGFVALVSCDNITVKNLNLTKNRYGILLVNTTNSKILNNTANNNDDTGIYLYSSSNNTITNNTVNNNGNGIYLYSSSNYNTITNNTVNNNNEGIYLVASSSNTIISNTANNNVYGIELEFSSDNLLGNNEIRNITYDGISVQDSINCNISNNLIENVSDYAIYFDNVNFSRIENNDIFNTAGISIDDSISNTITSNRIINSTFDGIVACTQNNTITYNYIENVNQYGIELTGMATGEYVAHNIIINASRGISLDQQTYNNTILNNTISEIDYGIYLYFNSANNILTNKILDYKRGIIVYLGSGNNISNNFLYHGGNGIILNSSNNNVLISNLVNWTYWDAGIYLYFSNGSMLMNNMVNGSEGSGIYLEYSNDNKLIGNSANKNSYGIWISYANNNNLTSNTLPYNQYGIDIDHSNNTFILNNNVSSNTENGMQIEYSNSNTISNNIINSNGYNGIHLYQSDNNTILNNNINSNNRLGILLEASNSNHIINNTAKDNGEWDFYSDTNSLDNVVINLDVGSTIVSFESKDIALKKALSPGGEPLGNIGKYVNVTNTSADSWFYLNISYSDSELGNVIESTLKMWKYNGSWYQLTESGVNTLVNYVYSGNITEFSIFAPLGEVSTGGGGGRGGGGGAGGGYVPAVCGNGKCEYLEDYLKCPEDCNAPEEPPKNITLGLGNISYGIQINASFAQVFRFIVKGKEHIMQVGKITSDNVTLWVWSAPIKVLLKVGQKKQIDLDGNNFAELEILLSKIENGKAFLGFKEIEEEIEETVPPSVPSVSTPQPSTQQQETVKQEKPWIPLVIVAVLVVLIVIVSIVSLRKKR